MLDQLNLSRRRVEDQIERLIDLLDSMDLDPDLEDNGDLEPSIGTCFQGVVDAELDTSDNEPSLGSPEGALGMHWGGGGCSDLEEEVRAPSNAREQHQDVGVPYRGIRRWHEAQTARAVDERLAEIVGRKKRHVSRDEPGTHDTHGVVVDDVFNVRLVRFEDVRR